MRTLTHIARFVVAEFLPDSTHDELPHDLDLIEHGIIDSLGVLKLVAMIENEFGITVEPEEYDHMLFRSIQAIHAFIHFKIGPPQPALT